MDDEVLTGGNVTPVIRRGGTVLREAGPWTPNVHALLDAYQRAQIDGVPRALGMTADGRERLTFVPGTVPRYPLPDEVWHERHLVPAGRLLRALHDASTGLLSRREGWRQRVREPVEVICHNDVAPHNMVFREGLFAGFIDVDMASPGPRLWDLASLAYRLCPYAEDAQAPEAARSARDARADVLLRAYGSEASRPALFAVMVSFLEELAAFSDAQAERAQRPELREHAAMYRRDAARVAGLSGA